jgi:mannose-1-phosphate guanylyltransferase
MQPSNLDTGPGIFFPAASILGADPSATVLIFPSDHFVFPVKRFLPQIQQLAEIAETFQDRIVLLGVKPNRPEADYGWIKPGPVHNPGGLKTEADGNLARTVDAFTEKPSPQDAENYRRKGYLWNTMIMAVKIQTLWKLGQRFLPAVVSSFDPFVGTSSDNRSCDPNFDLMKTDLVHAYSSLNPENFSKGLLQRAPEHILVTSMDDVLWDDWGRPDRIVESLAQIGRIPAFLGRLHGKDVSRVQHQTTAVNSTQMVYHRRLGSADPLH